MASSSVSQDDIDTDFEKNSRRSRIRTARAARQIAGGCSSVLASCRSEVLMSELPDLDNAQDNEESTATAGAVSPCIHHHTSASGSLASAAAGDLPSAPGGNTGKNTEEDVGRRLRGGVKKGKQHRERRKLREKRRSTGVVHLASTESTGGSTTPDEAESSDNETKRNTLLNEADNVLLPTGGGTGNRQHHIPSDLEADDENDAEHSLYPNVVSSNNTFNNASNTNASDEPMVVKKVVQENKRLLSMMDEKDKKIHNLEYKIEQLLKDTLTISEEQSRLQKENITLLRALNNISTTDKP